MDYLVKTRVTPVMRAAGFRRQRRLFTRSTDSGLVFHLAFRKFGSAFVAEWDLTSKELLAYYGTYRVGTSFAYGSLQVPEDLRFSIGNGASWPMPLTVSEADDLAPQVVAQLNLELPEIMRLGKSSILESPDLYSLGVGRMLAIPEYRLRRIIRAIDRKDLNSLDRYLEESTGDPGAHPIVEWARERRSALARQ